MSGNAAFRVDADAPSETVTAGVGSGFDLAVAGAPARLHTSHGYSVELRVRRWHRRATGPGLWMLRRCVGPTVDIGCGPGRLVAWLLDHQIPALGVDSSSHAGAVCGTAPAAVLHADVFDPLPNEGRWAHVLLADGNIGIGGDPLALLTRCAQLVSPAGSVLVELEPTGTPSWTGHARVETASDGGTTSTGPWFRWASVGMDALDDLAALAGLQIVERHHGRRSFAQLRQVTGIGL